MEGSIFFPLPEGLRITEVCHQESGLLITVLSERHSARCPLCQQASTSVHSRYVRWLRDVPCAGQRVYLQLRVHKFFCRNQECPRQVFTERLPTFVEPWAQMTLRLIATVQAVGLATSGSLGARLVWE